MSIRSSAKALIIRDEKILLNRCRHSDGSVYYDLPGGGQNSYESIEQALVREVLEETGYHIRPLRFAALAEEIYSDPGLQARYPDYTHRLLHIFRAELTGEETRVPGERDLGMEASEWVALEDVPHLPETYPHAIQECLPELLRREDAVFLGTEWNHNTEP